MLEKTEKIWMDGKLVKWEEANVHVLTHTLHYGLSVFEGIRCYKTEKGPAVFRIKEHVKRLFDSCRIFQLELPYTPAQVEKAITDTVKANRLKACYIRPLVYLGYGSMGVYPKDNPVRLAIAAWPWGAYLGDEGLANGIRVKTSSFVRGHVNSNMSRGKVGGNYVTSQLAKKEATACGYDDTLLLDADGYVSEGSGANIFIFREGVLKTTPLTSILEGITRNTVLELARASGICAREERFTRDEVYISDEAFFTGTAAEITPIVDLDGRTIGSGKPGPATRKLQELFFSIVKGKNKKYSKWLKYI